MTITANRIARELAAASPVAGGTIYGFFCTLCRAETDEGEKAGQERQAWRQSEAWHDSHCLWVRARKWSRAHG